MIEAGCTHVYLEKPGAPTVAELEEMKAYAAEKGVPVYMGYNSPFVPGFLKYAELQIEVSEQLQAELPAK